MKSTPIFVGLSVEECLQRATGEFLRNRKPGGVERSGQLIDVGDKFVTNGTGGGYAGAGYD